MIREFIVEALREAGYHVIHASTGEEALAWCKRHAAGVLVTDVRLPGQVDGWQLAERFREQDPELPVIYARASLPPLHVPFPGAASCGSPSIRTRSSGWSKSLARKRERRRVSRSTRGLA
ncbi:Response regulator [Bradyrhizobium diazoefficiens]|nr:Response regulator [Bradyrhizobium diazoefficiens]